MKQTMSDLAMTHTMIKHTPNDEVRNFIQMKLSYYCLFALTIIIFSSCRHQQVKTYYNDGSLKEVFYTYKSKLDSNYVYYTRNGEVAVVGKFSNDYKHGKWTEFGTNYKNYEFKNLYYNHGVFIKSYYFCAQPDDSTKKFQEKTVHSYDDSVITKFTEFDKNGILTVQVNKRKINGKWYKNWYEYYEGTRNLSKHTYYIDGEKCTEAFFDSTGIDTLEYHVYFSEESLSEEQIIPQIAEAVTTNGFAVYDTTADIILPHEINSYATTVIDTLGYYTNFITLSEKLTSPYQYEIEKVIAIVFWLVNTKELSFDMWPPSTESYIPSFNFYNDVIFERQDYAYFDHFYAVPFHLMAIEANIESYMVHGFNPNSFDVQVWNAIFIGDEVYYVDVKELIKKAKSTELTELREVIKTPRQFYAERKLTPFDPIWQLDTDTPVSYCSGEKSTSAQSASTRAEQLKAYRAMAPLDGIISATDRVKENHLYCGTKLDVFYYEMLAQKSIYDYLFKKEFQADDFEIFPDKTTSKQIEKIIYTHKYVKSNITRKHKLVLESYEKDLNYWNDMLDIYR